MVEHGRQSMMARALVRAAAHFGQDPEQVMASARANHTRLVALAALYDALDGTSYRDLASQMGFEDANRASALVATARQAKWWPEMFVSDITGELVAEHYGERAL